jgi:NADPH:quinone reductase-like Zn-dependent oxidoreductase
MRAVVIERFGPPESLVIKDIPSPTPGRGEALVRVFAASLNPIDYKIRGGLIPIPFMLPRITGLDYAGEVVAVGQGVTEVKVGDRVCGAGAPFKKLSGSCAELQAATVSRMARMPVGVSYRQGAALPIAAVTAWQCIHELAKLQAGQTVLVAGASGGVGHFMVQLAKEVGAHVVGTCSPRNFEFVRMLGADETLDYRETAWKSRQYDVILDSAGGLSWSDAAPLLNRGGVLVTTQPRPGHFFARPIAWAAGKRVVGIMATISPDRLEPLLERVASGRLHVEIGATVPLDGTAEAHRMLEQGGRFRGKLIIDVVPPQ